MRNDWQNGREFLRGLNLFHFLRRAKTNRGFMRPQAVVSLLGMMIAIERTITQEG